MSSAIDLEVSEVSWKHNNSKTHENYILGLRIIVTGLHEHISQTQQEYSKTIRFIRNFYEKNEQLPVHWLCTRKLPITGKAIKKAYCLFEPNAYAHGMKQKTLQNTITYPLEIMDRMN
jgi:hypothetical protein